MVKYKHVCVFTYMWVHECVWVHVLYICLWRPEANNYVLHTVFWGNGSHFKMGLMDSAALSG